MISNIFSTAPEICTSFTLKKHCNEPHSLCMEIVQNSNGNLTVKCYDSEYPVGKKIEWSVKVGEEADKAMNSTNSDNATASINLSWKDDLKLGKRNSIVCKVKTHPSKNPNWQEKTAWIYEEDVLKFCKCGDCGN